MANYVIKTGKSRYYAGFSHNRAGDYLQSWCDDINDAFLFQKSESAENYKKYILDNYDLRVVEVEIKEIGV